MKKLVLGAVAALLLIAPATANTLAQLALGLADDALHAGPELARACSRVAPCATGDARLTPGVNLPARFVSRNSRRS